MLYTGGLTTVCFILSSLLLQLKFSYLSIIVKLTCVANKSYYNILEQCAYCIISKNCKCRSAYMYYDTNTCFVHIYREGRVRIFTRILVDASVPPRGHIKTRKLYRQSLESVTVQYLTRQLIFSSNDSTNFASTLFLLRFL